ncbi:hypothetical protein MMC06_005303 [Schaereria dolodes]|nr:hypothetical protein [Schaereria dolodes]
MAMSTDHNSSQNYTISSLDPQVLYGSQQLSPINSATATPVDVSPTFARNPNNLHTLPFATRQLRPPKSPMYVPAVLRPTERPPRPSPLTPPRSVEGSVDSLDGFYGSKPPSRKAMGESLDTSLLMSPAVGDVVPCAIPNTVASHPTREHWKPDSNALFCDAPVCHKTFSLFERRHHCRHCGHVFCSDHSHYAVQLNQKADFHLNGTKSRACKHCWEQYQKWQTMRPGMINVISSQSIATPGNAIVGNGRDMGLVNTQEVPEPPAANSVPRDWNWSTF